MLDSLKFETAFIISSSLLLSPVHGSSNVEFADIMANRVSETVDGGIPDFLRCTTEPHFRTIMRYAIRSERYSNRHGDII
jgi:hypothetical protein